MKNSKVANNCQLQYSAANSALSGRYRLDR